MLKEVFVFDTGVLFFHYSSDPNLANSDLAILSSGFLSAIKDFSESTRSDIVDSFSTETELFLFMRCHESTKVIVGVFDRTVLEDLARAAMKEVHELIVQTEIPAEKIPTLNTLEKNHLKTQIKTLASQLFGTAGQVAYIEKLLGSQTSVSLAFLVDATRREKIAHFARPKPLFREGHVNDFLLVVSNLSRTLSKLELPERYSYLVIRSQENVIASCWSGNLISVATGAPMTPEQDILNLAAKMCHHPSLESLVRLSNNRERVHQSTLLPDGSLAYVEGTQFSPASGIFFSTLLNNLNRFFKALTRRSFDQFKVVTLAGNKAKQLSITQKELSENFNVELIQYT